MLKRFATARWVMLAIGLAGAPVSWLSARRAWGDDAPPNFVAIVRAHFAAWDRDGDGELTYPETTERVERPSVHSVEAAALAAVLRRQREHPSPLGLSQEELVAPAALAMTLERDYARAITVIERSPRVLFASGAPNLAGFHQGALGDCFLLATLGAFLHRAPEDVKAMIAPNPDMSFTVRFRGGPPARVSSITDAELALGSTDGRQGLWLPVLEKSWGEFAEAHLARVGRPQGGDAVLAAASYGTLLDTFRLFTGHRAGVLELSDDRAGELRQLVTALRGRRLIACLGTGAGPLPPGMVPRHAYAVLGHDPIADRLHIWNPWGLTFAPTGPAGMEAGYPFEDGHAEVPIQDVGRLFSVIVYETEEPGRYQP